MAVKKVSLGGTTYDINDTRVVLNSSDVGKFLTVGAGGTATAADVVSVNPTTGQVTVGSNSITALTSTSEIDASKVKGTFVAGASGVTVPANAIDTTGGTTFPSGVIPSATSSDKGGVKISDTIATPGASDTATSTKAFVDTVGTPDSGKTIQGEIDDVEAAITTLNSGDTVTGSVDNKIKTKIETLDATVTNSDATKTVATITETDGVVAATFQDIQTMVGATTAADGDKGFVPKPLAADKDKFLKGDGTWATISGSISDVKVDGTSVVTSGVADLKTSATNPYDASTNVVATQKDITDAIEALDVTVTGSGTDKTINALTETDGKIAATFQSIQTMTAASASAAGQKGFAPAPAAGDQAKFLKGDATWSALATSDIPDLDAAKITSGTLPSGVTVPGSSISGALPAAATVPATQITGTISTSQIAANAVGATQLDSTIVDGTPSTTNKIATASSITTAIEGLDYTATGMGADKTIATLTETDGKIAATFQDIQTMTAATTGAAGQKGFVPAPAAGDNTKYLKGDGTWVDPIPAQSGNSGKYLTTDGSVTSWASIVDNVTSTSATAPLSANQGKLLNDRIDNLESVGRFLSIWNCVTGKPTTDPTTLPYTYKTGDYFRVGTVGATGNLRPNGSSYTGAASTTAETAEVATGDTYYFDGTNWILQAAAEGGAVQDVTCDGTSVVSGGVAVLGSSATHSASEFVANPSSKSNGQFLKYNGTSWEASALTNMTGASATAAGAAGAVPAPAAGDEGKYLKGDGTWGAITADVTDVKVDGTSILSSGEADFKTSTTHPYSASNPLATIDDISASGGGTVTSVQVQATGPVVSSQDTAQTATLNTTISLASGYGDTQNPYASKAKNLVLASPATAAGVPTFRSLDADDIPNISAAKITSGTLPTAVSVPASTLTGSVPATVSVDATSLTGTIPTTVGVPASTLTGTVPSTVSVPASTLTGTVPATVSIPASTLTGALPSGTTIAAGDITGEIVTSQIDDEAITADKISSAILDNTPSSSDKLATVASITGKINALDKADSAVANQFVTAVSETDGIISVSRAALTAADIPALDAAKITSGTLPTTVTVPASTLSGNLPAGTQVAAADITGTIASSQIAANAVGASALDSTIIDGTASSTNKIATASSITTAINNLDATITGMGTDKTLLTLAETNGVVSATFQDIQTMSGASSAAAGTKGFVPAPAAGDEGKYLKGDGTWDTVTAGVSDFKVDGTSVISGGVGSLKTSTAHPYSSSTNVLATMADIAAAGGGTVTSVQVQATAPVQSSTSSAQTATLNTTISLASGYGDTQNPYAAKTKNYVLAAPTTANGAPSFRALDASDLPVMTGATSLTPGTSGAVPAPGTGEEGKFLKGDGSWESLPQFMIFKGTLGTGGTIADLPAASLQTIGYTYKVITAGTYGTYVAKPGDVFTCNDTPAWVLIPSGDEPSGTVTNVATGTGLTGGPITSTGTISLDTAYGDSINPYGSKTQNFVLAAPATADGAPSFRAMDASDIPALDAAKITSGTLPTTVSVPASTLTGSLPSTLTFAASQITGTISESQIASGAVAYGKLKSSDVIDTQVPLLDPPTNKIPTVSAVTSALNNYPDNVTLNTHSVTGQVQIKDGGVSAAKLAANSVTAAKIDTTIVDGTISTTNKIATASSITTAISALDATITGMGTDKTLATLAEADGVISATFQDIQTMTGASATDAGTKGFAPAPAAGDEGKYLKGDGTWAVPVSVSTTGTSTDEVNYITVNGVEKKLSTNDMTGATTSAAGVHGLVPAPASANIYQVLTGDGTWAGGIVQGSGTAPAPTAAIGFETVATFTP